MRSRRATAAFFNASLGAKTLDDDMVIRCAGALITARKNHFTNVCSLK